ncbi:MAG TPA: PAS domain-containing protein [Roseiarcus sp.]
MKLAATIELFAYWNRLRGARSAPERNDVDPGAIRGVLADTFVLDFDARRGFPFRISGSRANALFLRELRGFSFLDLWRDADREEIDSILHCIADEAQPFLIGAEARPPNLDAVDVEIILMPLRHHGLTHARVLGGLAVHSAPAWIGLRGAGPIALTSLRALDPPTRERRAPEGAAPIDFSLRDMPRRYKHLFVYSGDRPAT